MGLWLLRHRTGGALKLGGSVSVLPQRQQADAQKELELGATSPLEIFQPQANYANAELSVSLIDALGNAFGEAGLSRVLDARYRSQLAQYGRRIPASLPLKEKLKRLAHIRTDEGYMAETKTEAGGCFLLVENHCPICAAANACKGFCTTELNLFREVLGPDVAVERVEHIVAGDRRCAYRIQRSRS